MSPYAHDGHPLAGPRNTPMSKASAPYSLEQLSDWLERQFAELERRFADFMTPRSRALRATTRPETRSGGDADTP